MKKYISILLLSAISLFAASIPLHVRVDIYQNISFLSKTYEIYNQDNISFLMPLQTQLENIKFKSTGCKTQNLQLSVPKKMDTENIKKLEIKITEMENKIKNIEGENVILKTISLKQENIENINELLSLFDKNYMGNLKQLSSLKDKLDIANQELKKLQNQNAKKYKVFKASFTCKEKSRVQITYPEYNFTVRHFYIFNAKTGTKSLEFTKKIKILQKTGENFQNLDIYAHSNSYNRRVAPSPFYPKYLNSAKKERMFLKQAPAIMGSVDKSRSYKENFTTSSFIAKHIDINNNKEKIIVLQKENIKVVFENDIDGYGSSLAYLKAKFKSDKFYPGANSYIYLNNNQIGIKWIPNIQKDSEVSLFFGENQNIKVEKKLIKKFNESEFFSNNRKNTQIWQYKIKNISKIAQKVNLIERLPVSQNEDIKIKPLYDTKNAKMQKNGKVVWSFILKPNERKIIKFGYEIIKPKS